MQKSKGRRKCHPLPYINFFGLIITKLINLIILKEVLKNDTICNSGRKRKGAGGKAEF